VETPISREALWTVLAQPPLTERYSQIMSSCAFAFLLFLERHRDVFEAESPVVVKRGSMRPDSW
jgi:hypothetical protein